MATMGVVQLRGPFGDPAIGLPALDLGDKAPVAGSEVLRAHVQSTRIAAFARHATATAAAFIEKLNDVPGIVQRLGS